MQYIPTNFCDCKGQNVDIRQGISAVVRLKVEHCQTLRVVSTFTD